MSDVRLPTNFPVSERTPSTIDAFNAADVLGTDGCAKTREGEKTHRYRRKNTKEDIPTIRERKKGGGEDREKRKV